VILFALGAIVRLRHLHDVRTRTPDEIVYTRDAKLIGEKGIAPVVQQLPLKVTYLTLLAGVMKMTGATDENVGARLSYCASLASLALVALIGVRFLPPLAAVYALLSTAFSLLSLVVARRCWQESLMECLGLLIVLFACEITRDHNKWWPYAALFVTGAFAVLVKQLGVILCVAAVLYVTAVLISRRAWRALAFLGAAGVVTAAFTVFALSRVGIMGRLSTLWLNFYTLPATHPSLNPWAAENQSGPWYSMTWGLWIINPLNLALCAVAAGIAVMPRSVLQRLGLPLRAVDLSILRLLCWTTVFDIAVVSVAPLAQNFRYLAPIYGPIYLLGGIGLWAAVTLVRQRPRWLAYPACAILAFLAVAAVNADYNDFEQLYVEAGVHDLAISIVLHFPDLKTKWNLRQNGAMPELDVSRRIAPPGR
jgi:hypothetical protein